jgi:hypothetical protein
MTGCTVNTRTADLDGTRSVGTRRAASAEIFILLQGCSAKSRQPLKKARKL